MNCTVCGKDINDHVEDRSCDRCVAKKLGWADIREYPQKMSWASGLEGRLPNSDEWANIPHYSSPEMSPETWGLVERFGNDFALWKNVDGKGRWCCSKASTSVALTHALTPTLAICRAFLAIDNKKEAK